MNLWIKNLRHKSQKGNHQSEKQWSLYWKHKKSKILKQEQNSNFSVVDPETYAYANAVPHKKILTYKQISLYLQPSLFLRHFSTFK